MRILICVVYQVSNCQPWVSARVAASESESQEVEVFGWSRIPKNTRNRSRIFFIRLQLLKS